MKQPQPPPLIRQRPTVTGADARTELLRPARGRTPVPLRKTFVQKPPGADCRHGPLRDLVANGDLRGLRAYLITVAATSHPNQGSWTTTFDSAVWARLMDIDQTATDAAARTGAARTLRRLEDRKLVRCFRARGSSLIAVTLLREDGSGDPYTRPDGSTEHDRFIRLPPAFWTAGYDAKVDMPALAMFLAIAHAKPWSAFPATKMEQWYGWSEDTTLRGVKKLLELQLIERRETYQKAPLSPTGLTMTYQFRLARSMRPGTTRRKEASKP